MGKIKKNNQLYPLQLYLSSVDLKSPDQYLMKSSGPLYLQLPCEMLIGSESSGKPAPAKCSSVKYSSKASDLIVVQLWGFTSSLHPVEDKQGFKHLLLGQNFRESVESRELFSSSLSLYMRRHAVFLSRNCPAKPVILQPMPLQSHILLEDRLKDLCVAKKILPLILICNKDASSAAQIDSWQEFSKKYFIFSFFGLHN